MAPTPEGLGATVVCGTDGVVQEGVVCVPVEDDVVGEPSSEGADDAALGCVV